MTVLGLGTDLVDVEELRASSERQPGRYLERIFSSRELEYARKHADPVQCLAGKLAAKESFMKSLGTGWSEEVDWLHIEVLNHADGAPYLELNGGAEKKMVEIFGKGALVSISHLPAIASAVVLIVR